MANWNPNATGTLGMEWMPVFAGAVNLDGNNKYVAESFDQTAGAVITGIQVPNVGIAVRGGIYAVEVFDNETAVGDLTPTMLEAQPNEDVSDGLWLNSNGNNTSMSAYIDEGQAAASAADYVRVSAVASVMSQRLNTGGLSLAGRRILALRLNVLAAIGPTGFLSYGLNIGGTDFTGAAGIAGPRQYAWYSTWWTYNPSTHKPWTIADVQAFDTTDEFWLGGSTQPGWTAVDVAAVTMNVFSISENRIALGIMDDTSSGLTAGAMAAPQINTAAMLTPTGGAWTKDGAGRHLYTLRRLSSTGSMSIPFFQTAPSAPAAALGRSWQIKYDFQYGHAIEMGDTIPRLSPFIQRTSAPANSVDSIPWSSNVVAYVYTGVTAQQEIDSAAAAAYGVLRFYVYDQFAQPGVTLDVKIKRRSDNVQLGGTYQLTDVIAASFPAYQAGGYWRLVQVQLPSNATLAVGVQYYIEFSSAAPVEAPWAVAGLNSNGLGQEATYRGTTNAATVNGAAESTSIDLFATLSTVPTAPASMTATLGSQTVGETVACVTAIPRADLSWAATSLGGTFTRYEVQRSEDAGSTWTDIFVQVDESGTTFKDYEARRGVQALYRIRVVRNDSAFSAWRQAAAGVTKPLLAGTGAYAATMYLVSSYDPALNLAYEYQPSKEYDFNEADEQRTQGAYGRDYQLGSNPIENRGVTPHWTLLVGIDDKTPAGGRRAYEAFTPLRELARAVIPYVCVLDHHGNRLFGQLHVPSGSEDATGTTNRYLAEVTMSQLADMPFVVTRNAADVNVTA